MQHHIITYFCLSLLYLLVTYRPAWDCLHICAGVVWEQCAGHCLCSQPIDIILLLHMLEDPLFEEVLASTKQEILSGLDEYSR